MTRAEALHAGACRSKARRSVRPAGGGRRRAGVCLGGARACAASRRFGRLLREVVLDERGRAALTLIFAVHALLTLLLYALLWALRG